MTMARLGGYWTAVDHVAALLAERRKLERGGQFHQGWFDATARLMKELQKASEKFPGYVFDILDDAYRKMLAGRR